MFVANREEYDRRNFHIKKQRQMEITSATNFIKDVKRNFRRNVSVETTADEMMEEYANVFNSSAVQREIAKLPIHSIQMNPTDEVEANYLNTKSWLRSYRAEEYQKLTQKLKFLETIEMNDDIKANQFIFDVQIAMDAKNKAIEAEEANKRKRQRLGSFVLSLAQPSPAPAPAQSGSFFNFFRPRSNSSPRWLICNIFYQINSICKLNTCSNLEN